MPLNLLAISIGNTRTRVGLFVDDKLGHTHALANGDLARELPPVAGHALGHLQRTEGGAILLASVNPALTDRALGLLGGVTDANVLRVERDLAVPIGRQVDLASTVGEDRLLNAAAAYDALKQACVVVDAGTATTVDFVDGAGTFHGGAIGPGPQMVLDALHRGTAQLPEVRMAPPAEAIGHNTAEAMRAGAFHGLRGMVRELVEKYAEIAGSYPVVIATGGNAEMLFKDYGLVERIVPDLTLLGLAATYRMGLKPDED